MRDVRRGFVVQDCDYREAIPRAAQWDLDFVEILMEGRYDRHRVRAQANAIGTLAATEEVSVLVHLPLRCDLCSPYERVRSAMHREMEDCLEAADCVSARKAVLPARTDAWRPAYDDAKLRDRLMERILDLHSFADHVGVELCVQNTTGEFFTLRDHFPDLMDHEVAVSLDTGHAAVEGLNAGAQASLLSDNGERISHVHLTDPPHPGTDDQHLFGDETGDIETLVEPIREDWSGTISLADRWDDWEALGERVQWLDQVLDAESSVDPDVRIP